MRTEGDEDFRRLCLWLFIATKGGRTRLNILKSIFEQPMNAHQLSVKLRLNYRTIEHHLQILRKNGLVTVVGDGYGQSYFPSEAAVSNKGLIEELERRFEGGA